MRSKLFDFEFGVRNVVTDLVQLVSDSVSDTLQLTRQERDELEIGGGRRSTSNVGLARLMMAHTLRPLLWVDCRRCRFSIGYKAGPMYKPPGWIILATLIRVDHSALCWLAKRYPKQIADVSVELGEYAIPEHKRNTGVVIHGL